MAMIDREATSYEELIGKVMVMVMVSMDRRR
jgi:hypothetical protein